MKKYTVITALFGNYECLRDNQYKHPDVEYICVTDRINLCSNTWKIVYAPAVIDPSWSDRRKTYYVRYHLHEFSNSENLMWIDGSIELRDMTDIFETFSNSQYTMLNLGGYPFKEWFHNFSMFSENCKSIFYMDEEYFLLYYNKIQNLLEYMKVNGISNKHPNYQHINGRARIFKNTKENRKLLVDCWNLLISNDLMKNPFNIQRGKHENFYDIYYYDEIVFGLVCREIYTNWNYNYNEFPFTVYKHNSNEILR